MMPKTHGENKLFTTCDAHGNDALLLAVFTSHTHKSPSIENGNGSENISSAVLTWWVGKSDSEWLLFFFTLSAKTEVYRAYSLQILDSQQVPVTLRS